MSSKAMLFVLVFGGMAPLETAHWQSIDGHLEVLKFARVNGCTWDEWVCYLLYGRALVIL